MAQEAQQMTQIGKNGIHRTLLLLLLVAAVYNTAKAHPVLSACTFTKNRRRQPVLIEVENAFSSVIGILLHNIRRHTISVCSMADDVHDPADDSAARPPTVQSHTVPQKSII